MQAAPLPTPSSIQTGPKVPPAPPAPPSNPKTPKSKSDAGGFGAAALILSALAVVTGALAFYRADQTFSLLKAQLINTPSAAGDAAAPVPSEPVALEIGDEDPFTGSADAKVTVVEFSDFQCPFCKVFSETTKELRTTYKPDEVRFVYLDFPLTSIHENAEPAAVAAQCVADLAGNTAFFEFHDELFARQDELGDKLYSEIAAGISGLDQDKFASCVKNQDTLAEVTADLDLGVALGVGGTPTTFINGVQVKGGAVAFDKLKSLIDTELQK